MPSAGPVRERCFSWRFRRVFSILAGLDSSQAHSLVISADWNAYELAEGNDYAYEQTVTRGAFWRCNFLLLFKAPKTASHHVRLAPSYWVRTWISREDLTVHAARHDTWIAFKA